MGSGAGKDAREDEVLLPTQGRRARMGLHISEEANAQKGQAPAGLPQLIWTGRRRPATLHQSFAQLSSYITHHSPFHNNSFQDAGTSNQTSMR